MTTDKKLKPLNFGEVYLPAMAATTVEEAQAHFNRIVELVKQHCPSMSHATACDRVRNNMDYAARLNSDRAMILYRSIDPMPDDPASKPAEQGPASGEVETVDFEKFKQLAREYDHRLQVAESYDSNGNATFVICLQPHDMNVIYSPHRNRFWQHENGHHASGCAEAALKYAKERLPPAQHPGVATVGRTLKLIDTALDAAAEAIANMSNPTCQWHERTEESRHYYLERAREAIFSYWDAVAQTEGVHHAFLSYKHYRSMLAMNQMVTKERTELVKEIERLNARVKLREHEKESLERVKEERERQVGRLIEINQKQEAEIEMHVKEKGGMRSRLEYHEREFVRIREMAEGIVKATDELAPF